MRVLVTGGAGFIGSSLVYALVSSGHDVVVLDDLSSGTVANLHPAAVFHRVDILDPAVPALVAGVRPEAVVHLAAQADVGRSIADPARDRAVNVDGTSVIARAAAAAGARLVLSASSAAVYGEPEAVPLLETAAKRPANPYGASKLAAERALSDALAGTGVDFASMRFANVYGPRQAANGEGGVVARFAAALVSGEAPRIYGDGSQTRDFIFVGDVVGFILAALGSARPLAGPLPDGPAYNVSTGRETSVDTLAEALRAFSGADAAFERLPGRAGDIARSALDPSKAAATLGWEARTDMKTGLALTWNWFAAAERQ